MGEARFDLSDVVAMRSGLPGWTREAIADARAAGRTWESIAEELKVSVRGARFLLEDRSGDG